MFSNLNELTQATEEKGDWLDNEVEVVTPDGKRWCVDKFRLICNSESDDIVELHLKEIHHINTAEQLKGPSHASETR